MEKTYQAILRFIAITILATIAIQVYWNVIHYQSNKAELLREVNSALNKGIEYYYTDLAREHEFKIIRKDSTQEEGQHYRQVIRSGSEVHLPSGSEVNNINIIVTDSLPEHPFLDIDSLMASQQINELATKIFISISTDSIKLERLATFMKESFAQKEWEMDFALLQYDSTCIGPDTIDCDSVRTFGLTQVGKNPLSTKVKSPYLPAGSSMEIQFSNVSRELLGRSLIGMLLSLLLSIAIIGCLVFLLRIIRRQKEVATIKNDLISNISHEFKTPITTIASALEGIALFNEQNDVAKTKKYVGIGQDQLKKLHVMVEKLLETATLESEQLVLEKEEVDSREIIEHVLSQYKLLSQNKSIVTDIATDLKSLSLDVFHFENALSNLVDNALKYGGEKIIVRAKNSHGRVVIEVEDNGVGIGAKEQKMIFEQFYRIPTGNVHTIKGFGIGLYYARQIVEKHGGTLEVSSSANKTIFRIQLDEA